MSGTGNIAVSISLCYIFPATLHSWEPSCLWCLRQQEALRIFTDFAAPQNLAWLDFDFKKHKWLYINNTWKGSSLFRSCLGFLANLPLRNRLKWKIIPLISLFLVESITEPVSRQNEMLKRLPTGGALPFPPYHHSWLTRHWWASASLIVCYGSPLSPCSERPAYLIPASNFLTESASHFCGWLSL